MIELKVISDVYKEKEILLEDGHVAIEEVLQKKNVIRKKLVEVNDITSVQEVLTDRAVPYKTRCLVHIQGEGHMVVKHKYEYIKQLKESKRYGGQTRRIGF